MLGRDFLMSARAKREREQPPSSSEGVPTVGFPDMKEANVRVVFASIWAAACNNPMAIDVKPCYETSDEAREQGEKQLSYYEKLTTRTPFRLIRNRQNLQNVVKGAYRLGFILSMEGADPILSPGHLHEWVERGVRVVGLAHGRTRYAGGTKQPGPLTQLGRELLREMERQSVILDTSHMAEESFFQAVDSFSGRIIATHSNCRALIPTDRHLTDEMIRAIIEREGVIGVVLFNKFLSAEWEKSSQAKGSVTLGHVVKQVEHICEVAGDSNHVGIGSDLDGGFGSESIPAELDTIADMPKIADALKQAEFSEEEVTGILGENWLRFLNAALPNNGNASFGD
jgi:membrane dipeptidase